MFSDNNRIKLDINHNKISLQIQNIWKLNSMLLFNP